VSARRIVVALLGALVLVLAACGGADDSTGQSSKATTTAKAPVVRIGTKNFTEQFILGELYRQALEAKGFRVAVKPDIGSSEVTDKALTTGGIDMYPEYVGVMLSEIARRPDRPKSPEAAYREAKAFQEGRGFTLLAMTPFSDSNALAVLPRRASKDGLKSIADLKKLPGTVKIAAPPEFATRFEGAVGLAQRYGLTNIEVVPTPIGKQYEALDKRKVDAAVVFTTDGMLEQGGYRVLTDLRGVFGYQQAAPVVNQKFLRDAGPEFRAVLDAVSRKLTTGAMREMNADVGLRGALPADVAGRFLDRAGLR
jgi:osmoprotectant transport system substrate-binding protein